MANELPIACSLSAADLAARLADIAAVGREALLSAERAGPRATLRFRGGVTDRLTAIVEAESRCCAFLQMRLEEVGDGTVLTIAGPAGSDLVVAELVDAFAGGAR